VVIEQVAETKEYGSYCKRKESSYQIRFQDQNAFSLDLENKIHQFSLYRT
jgi:hypothetical protein